MWPQRPAPYLVLAAALGPLPVLAAALGTESVLTRPNPKYLLILFKIVEIEGLSWPQRLAP